MADIGKIPPAIPTPPARPAEGVVHRRGPPPDKQPKRDPHSRSRKQPQDDVPHIDEYA